jgi:UDP-N-acetylmuramate dehydrogenase
MRYEQRSSASISPIIQTNISLADKNWFQTGGSACFFAEPHSAQEFVDAMAHAHRLDLPMFLLGAGANVLISDEGFDGLVIHPQIKDLVIHSINGDEAQLTAGAGVVLPDLIEYCLENQLLGPEEFSGIPGTVGGAVYINLHYFEFLIADFLVSAQVVDAQTGELQTVDRDWFSFGYNQSRLHEGRQYLVSATFRLKRGSDHEIAYARGRRYEIIRQRAARYPKSHTCGSFFRNFYDHEVTIEDNGKKMVYIAYYLDKIGIKGQLQIGGARVSYQHANMIVNQGNATSADVIAVARRMQELVIEQFGVLPKPECRLVGFKNYPLVQDGER